MLPARDTELVQIVDRALADAVTRGGAWLACRPGCTPCCHGVFRISALDAERLRAGLDGLREEAPDRAEAVQARARAAVRELSAYFPGDAQTGVLAEQNERWDEFADLPQADAPCPALAPATGTCDLYSARPLTCRIFGPPVQNQDGIGVCELCYAGAGEAEILAGEMRLEHHDLEAELDRELAAGQLAGETVVAWALLDGPAIRVEVDVEVDMEAASFSAGVDSLLQRIPE